MCGPRGEAMSQMGAEQHSPTKQPCCDLVHVSPKDQGHCLSAALSCICSPGRGCRCTEVWAGLLQPTCSCVSGRPWLSLSPRLCGNIHLKGRRGNYTHFVKCVQCWATAPGRAVLGAGRAHEQALRATAFSTGHAFAGPFIY